MAGTVGVAPGTTTINMPDGSTIQISDWIDDKLYATVQLTNGQTTPVQAFTTSRSAQIPGGTRSTTNVDTNLTRSGDVGLPQSWEMLIYGIGSEIERVMRANTGGAVVLPDGNGALSAPATLQTLFNIDRVMFLQFSYNNKIYTNGCMQDYPQGRGFSAFSTQAAFEFANNGVPSPRDRNALVLPIPMRDGLSYAMVVNPEAPPVINQLAADGGANLTFADQRFSLYGLIKRGVV